MRRVVLFAVLAFDVWLVTVIYLTHSQVPAGREITHADVQCLPPNTVGCK